MKDMDTQSFMSIISPPTGKDLGRYLSAVERALGFRSDAELAGMIGVAPGAIANWKRRGSVPADHLAWFTEVLVPRIASTWVDVPRTGRTARAAVIKLIVNTEGNPLGVPRFQLTSTAQALGGLFAFAEFLTEVKGVSPHQLNSDEVDRIEALLAAGMHQFVRGADLFAEQNVK
jgi:hypothetical protein